MKTQGNGQPALRIALASLLMMLASSVYGQYVNVQVYTNYLWHREGGTFGPCWESGDEEYTSLVYANLDGGGWQGGGCFQCTANGDCSMNPNYTPLNTNTLATTVGVRLFGFEDDGGSRCSYDSGDDCLSDNNWSFTIRNLPRATWNSYNDYGSSDHRMNFQIYWNWLVPPAPSIGGATGTSNTSFTANWSNADGNYRVTNYYLYVATDSGFSNIVSGYNGLSMGTSTSRVVSGLTAGQTYYYRVIAGNEAGNSGVSSSTSVSLPKLDQTISFGSLAGKIYGDATFTVSATASSGLGVSFTSLNTSVATVSGNTITIVGVGSAVIRASQAGNSSYNAAPNVDQTLTVGKASQTISFGSLAAKTYGDAAFTVSASASSGLGVTFTSLNTNVATVSGNVITIVGVGTASIRASQGGNTNYNAAADVDQTLTVNAKALTIASPAVTSKTYDGTTAATITGSLSGIVGSDSVTLNGTGTFNTSSVGSGKAVTSTSTLSGAQSGRYTLTQPTGLTGIITAKALTVSNPAVASKIYDRTTAATITGTLSGVVSGDTVGFSGTGIFDNANIGTGKAVTSTLTLTGAQAGNYTLTQPSGLTGAITAKALTVSSPLVTAKTYDGTTAASLTGTLAGVIGSDAVVLNGTGTFDNKNVGSNKPVTSTSTLTGAQASNYTLTQPTGLTGTITTKALTISDATVTTKVYDGTTSAAITGTLVGVVSGDTVSLTGSGNFDNKNAGGSKPVTSNSTLVGADASNYTLTHPTGLTGTILARDITVTAQPDSKTYGAADPVFGYSSIGMVGGDSFSGALSRTPGETPGSYSILQGSLTAGSNYSLTFESAEFTIQAKVLTVSNAAVEGKVYDGTTAATITGTLAGVVGSDDVSLVGTGTFATANVGGGIAVTSTSTITGAQAANYTLTQPVGLTGSITAKTLTVSNAQVTAKVYDGTTSAALTGTLVGVVGSDSVSLLGSGSFATANVGDNIPVTSSSTLTGAQADNYTLTQPTALTGEISAKSLTIPDAAVTTKLYDGTTNAVITGTLSGIAGSDDVTFTGTGTFSTANVGSGISVTFTGALEGTTASNYTLLSPSGLTGTIAASSLTVSNPAVANKVYDGTTTAVITGTLSGVLAGDTVTLIGAGTFISPDAGTAIPVTANCSLGGPNAANYVLAQPAGLAGDITPLALTVSSAAVTAKPYDGNTNAIITGTLTGVIGADAVTLEGAGTFASADAGSNIPVTSTSTLSGADADNYSLVQPSGLTGNITAMTVTVLNPAVTAKVYDGTTNAVITGTLSGVVGADEVILLGTGEFAASDVGANIPVTSSSALSGAQAANYTLTQPTGLTGTITAKSLTLASAIVTTKVYDGTTTATITGTIVGAIAGDDVSIQGTGSFASPKVGSGIAVTAAITLQGSSAGNYTLVPPTGLTGEITPLPLQISNAAVTTKVYDGNADAEITGILNGVIGTDDVSLIGTGTFATITAGTSIPVTSTSTLSGADADNYSLFQPTGLTGTITATTLTVTNAIVVPKIYDGTTVATITGTLTGVAAGDQVTLVGAGSFASSSVGADIAVTASCSLAGAQAANYSLVQPTGLSGTITLKALTVVDAAVVSKSFDGTDSATIVGTLSGVVGSDDVVFLGMGTFATTGPGDDIVVISNSTLGGSGAGNYTLTQPTGLTGDITVPGTVGFSADTVTVSPTAAWVTLTVARTAGIGAFSVAINTDDGTPITGSAPFAAAVAGTDYIDLAGSTAVVNFGPDDLTQEVTIVLKPKTTAQPNKHFTATLSDPTNGAVLGSITTTDVRIMSPDSTKPTVTITAPASGAKLATTNPTVTVTGKASDKSGIASARVVINGAPAIEAVLGAVSSSATGVSVDWSVTFTPVVGLNTVAISAEDAMGNVSTAVTRSFTFQAMGAITVSVNPPSSGTLAFTPLSVTGTTLAALGTTYTVAAVGTTYTVVAKPAIGYFFDGWSGTAAFSTTTGASTTFTHVAGNTVTANFAPSPFLANSVAGTYNGIVKGSTAATNTQANTGLFNATITPTTGAFTGKLSINGMVSPVAGAFNYATRTFKSSVANNGYNFDLFLDTATGRITGDIVLRKRGVSVAILNVNAPIVHSKSTAVGAGTVPVPAASIGTYNVGFSAPTAPATLLADEYPAGRSYGIMNISGTDAAAKVAGVLADGTAYSSAAYLCRDGTVPVYAPFALGIGSLVGTLEIDTSSVTTDATGTDLFWFKGQNGGHYYPWGFDAGLTLNAVAAKLATSSVNSLALTSSPHIVFSDGPFASAIDKTLTLLGTAYVSAPNATDKSTKVSFNVLTSLVTVEYTPLGGLKHAGKGIIVSKGGVSSVHAYILSPLPTHTTGNGLGAAVTITP